jgi:hypothetical protein
MDGTIIEGVYIDGPIVINADNVIIRDFYQDSQFSLYGILANSGAKNLTIEDGVVSNANSSIIYANNVVIRRVEMFGSWNDALKIRYDSLVEENWIHHELGILPGSHADGEQIREGSNVIFRCNNFDMPVGVQGTNSNACLMIRAGIGTVDNITIDSNWCNGGNYAVYSRSGYWGCPTNMQLTNTKFGRNYTYGLLSVNECGGDIYTCGNTWEDTGDLVTKANGGWDQDSFVCP